MTQSSSQPDRLISQDMECLGEGRDWAAAHFCVPRRDGPLSVISAHASMTALGNAGTSLKFIPFAGKMPL
jgi:hypothetical protein